MFAPSKNTLLYLLPVLFLSILHNAIAHTGTADTAYKKFQPEHKANSGLWRAEMPNPSNKIILVAGHVNRISGTTGYNDAPFLEYEGLKHSTEAALTKIIVPYMVKIGRQRGFDVEQFIPKSAVFKQAISELVAYEKKTRGVAFEIHTDAPSEGHHRSPGYDGQTGVIPPVNDTITVAEAYAGSYLGKFREGQRNLYAPKQGISLIEMFPTNKAITQSVQKAVVTNDFSRVEQLAEPYIHLFFDALERAGMKK